MSLSNTRQTRTTTEGGSSTRFYFLALLTIIIVIVAFWFIFKPRDKTADPVSTVHSEQTGDTSGLDIRVDSSKKGTVQSPLPVSKQKKVQSTRPVSHQKKVKAEKYTPELLPFPAEIGDLDTSLSHIDKAELTPERVSEISSMLQALAAEGVSSLPEIRALLDSGEDIIFLDAVKNPGLVEYDSLRLGLFDTLRQIGGYEAENILFDELRKTGNPVEIATLAGYLDEIAPAEYHEEAALIARSMLALANEGQIQGQDIGPIFYVLQEYGDASVLEDLEQNRDLWGHYVTIALAGMADGAGIPTLINIVEQHTGDDWGKNIYRDKDLLAIHMLAQVSIYDQKAHDALLEQASLNRIPDSFWPAIASVLSGDDQLQLVKPDINLYKESLYSWSQNRQLPYSRHGIQDSNVNGIIYSRHYSAKLSPDEADARLAMIDQMLSVTNNPAAVQALENARNLITTTP